MAGERIAIYKTESKIIEGDYGDFYNTISRTEAVERMAVAMCLKCNKTDTCENCLSASNGDCDLKSYYPLAEAALDALIKGE